MPSIVRASIASIASLVLATTPATGTTVPTFNGPLGDLYNANYSPLPAAALTTPSATSWWPALGGSQPYISFPASSASAVLSASGGSVYSLNAMADVVQCVTVSPGGGIALSHQVDVSPLTSFNFTLAPLPLLLSPVGVGARVALTLYYAFDGCVRNAAPQSCTSVVVALDAESLAPLWVWEAPPVDNANRGVALLLSPDGTRLVLVTGNNNARTANVTSLDPATGRVVGTVARLPSAIGPCGDMPPYVGRSLLTSAGLLVVSVGPGNGAPSSGATCAYAVDATTGALAWAVGDAVTWAPISTAGLGSGAPAGVAVLVLTQRTVMGLSTGGAIAWNVTYPGREAAVYGAALAPLPNPATSGGVLFVAAAWGRSYAVSTVYALDVATGSLLASFTNPYFPDGGVSAGQLLATQPSVYPNSSVAVFVRGTHSFADSVYGAVGASSDSAYTSAMTKLDFACGGGGAPAAATCSFTKQASSSGAMMGTPSGGALRPRSGQLLLVSSSGVQVIE